MIDYLNLLWTDIWLNWQPISVPNMMLVPVCSKKESLLNLGSLKDISGNIQIAFHSKSSVEITEEFHGTVKPVCNDHLYNKIYCLWFIQ